MAVLRAWVCLRGNARGFWNRAADGKAVRKAGEVVKVFYTRREHVRRL